MTNNHKLYSQEKKISPILFKLFLKLVFVREKTNKIIVFPNKS